MKNKILAVLAVVSMFAGAAPKKDATGNRAFLDITDGWRAQPISIAGLTDRSVFPQPLDDPKSDDEKSFDDLMNDDDLLGPSQFSSGKSKKKMKTANREEAKKRGTYIDKKGNPVNWLPQPVSLQGLMPLVSAFRANDAQNIYNAEYNCWYEKSIDIPAEWKGSMIVYEQEIMGCELAIFVNGKLAGVLTAPFGFVDLSDFLEYGKPNLFRVFGTNRGVGAGMKGVHYRARDDMAKVRHFATRAKLVRHTKAVIDDVFVDTRFREKAVKLHCQIFAKEPCTGEFSAEISEDAGGKVVKVLKKSFKFAAGTNTVELADAWTNFTTWETDRPFLYNCTTKLSVDGVECDGGAKILFGFREVWRERGQLVLNGHPQSCRGYYGGMPAPNDEKGWANWKASGYNTYLATHQHESKFRYDQKMLEAMARHGVLLFSGGPQITSCGDAAVNPVRKPQYERFLEYWARGTRNWPSMVGVSVGVNMMCAAWWTMGARDMGKGSGKGNIVEACKLVKRFHPNCLAFCHGDGNLCDVGGSNFYFNFTPLQEREEWYSDWYERRDREDTIPYYPHEFGQPYQGSWFGGAQPSMTEFCAIYFGEQAYRDEDERMLSMSREFAYSKAANYYGGWAPGEKMGTSYQLYDFSEAGKRLHELFVSRVTRAWRAWHCRMSPMYLEVVDLNPATNNFELAAHIVGNGDLCAFLGGDPDSGKQAFADRTHAYYGGTAFRKCVVAILDGMGEETLKAAWTLKDAAGKTLAEGTKTIALRQGDVKFEPIEIAAPKVAEKTKCTLSVAFAAKRLPKVDATDSMAIELYPAPKTPAAGATVALWDPRGETAEAFDAVGQKYRKVDTLSALQGASETHLVIGRRALDGIYATNELGRAFAKFLPLVEGGRRLLVMSQTGDVWHRLGFDSEDSAPRQFFNNFLPGVEDDELAYWAGEPKAMMDTTDWHWGPDWGPSQKWHKGGRGWRWRHTHALSLSTLLVPQRAGFRPLVKGEFDMAYSSLMRLTVGKGALTVCALDFEGRVGAKGDPAATKVLVATLDDYLADRSVAESRTWYSGSEAKRLAESLGLAAKEWDGKGAKGDVLLVGDDTLLELSDLKGAAKKGVRSLVVANNDIAKRAGFKLIEGKKQTIIQWRTKKMEFADDEARHMKRPKSNTDDLELDGGLGLSLEEEKVEKKKPKKPKGMTYHEIPDIWYATTNEVVKPFVKSVDTAAFGKFPFGGVGLSMLRWRESPRPKLLDGDPAGWTVTADGAFAISDDGMILIDQIAPFRVLDERTKGGAGGKGDPVGKANYALSLDNNFRRHSLVLETWGAKPGEAAYGKFFCTGDIDLYWSGARGYDPYSYVYW